MVSRNKNFQVTVHNRNNLDAIILFQVFLSSTNKFWTDPYDTHGTLKSTNTPRSNDNERVLYTV